jgi:hydrogenase expression/formation protein HypC
MRDSGNLFDETLKVFIMCLSVPGRILEISEEDGFKMGKVDFSGVRKRVCLQYVPDIQVGEYVLVHVGFAIAKLDEVEAGRTLKLLAELDDMQEDVEMDAPS